MQVLQSPQFPCLPTKRYPVEHNSLPSFRGGTVSVALQINVVAYGAMTVIEKAANICLIEAQLERVLNSWLS